MRGGVGAVVIVGLLGGALAGPASAGDEPKDMELESSAFESGGEIPLEFACDVRNIGGQNISPPLEWSKAPKGTKELVLLMDDVDASNPDDPEDRFVHWTLWRLKPKLRELDQGEVPEGGRQGGTDAGVVGYFGPCPPEAHTYELQLFALRKRLKLDDGASRDEFKEALASAVDKDQVLGQGSLEGVFTPPA